MPVSWTPSEYRRFLSVRGVSDMVGKRRTHSHEFEDAEFEAVWDLDSTRLKKSMTRNCSRIKKFEQLARRVLKFSQVIFPPSVSPPP